MSGSAYRLAIRDRLREQLELNQGECEIQEDGRPAPRAGHTFVAIHPGSWNARYPADYHLDEVIGVKVTISLKSGRYPSDTTGRNLTGNSQDADLPPFELLARQIIAEVHKNYTTMQAANDNIGNDSAGFIEPLQFTSAPEPQHRSAEWWSRANPPSARQSQPPGPAGMSQTITFDGARRIQRQQELDPT